MRITIPHTADARRRGPFDKQRSTLRARVEQRINRLTQFRRIATHSEQCTDNYLGKVTLGAILRSL
jgi:hypothetical protein